MKRTVIAMLLLTMTLGTVAQIKVETSEAMELMGILSRTAGYEEYCHDAAGQYSKDTEEWFAPYKNHPIIPYYQDIRAKYGISYEKVTNMAVHLDIEKGKVKLVGDRKELNNGWQNVDLNDFISRLNQFYTDTRFHEFYEQHRAFYNETAQWYQNNVIPVFHPEWYGRFYYGKEATETFRVIIGFSHGYNSNGIWRQLPGKPREVIAVCGYYLGSEKRGPKFDAAILIHEVCHSFVNPLLDDAVNTSIMQDTGQKLFHLSQPAMMRQAYNEWKTVINESLVRASVIIYLIDNGFNRRIANNVLTTEMTNNGFLWMPELVSALRQYAISRKKYRTLNDYYPEIARCLSKYLDTETSRITKALE
jgi:hypothetical protein